MENIAVLMGGKGTPIFNGTNFAHWKLKAEWDLVWIHDEMMHILTVGPIIPTRIVVVIKDAAGVTFWILCYINSRTIIY